MVIVLLTIYALRNVSIKDLYRVESIGAVTIFATDKTDTLTRSKISVVLPHYEKCNGTTYSQVF